MNTPLIDNCHVILCLSSRKTSKLNLNEIFTCRGLSCKLFFHHFISHTNEVFWVSVSHGPKTIYICLRRKTYLVSIHSVLKKCQISNLHDNSKQNCFLSKVHNSHSHKTIDSNRTTNNAFLSWNILSIVIILLSTHIKSVRYKYQ